MKGSAMTHLAPVAVLLMLATPAAAQSTEAPGLLERLLGGFMDQMIEDAAPHLENLERDMGLLAESMRPTMERAAALIDDVGNYQSPERLPNGDILIRRKPGAPPPPALPDIATPEAPAVPGDLFTPLPPGTETLPLPPGTRIEL